MGISYSADEIYQIGVQIEKNGKRFYEVASQKAGEKAVKDLFESLSKWEDEHVRLFTALRANLPQGAREQVSYDPGNELQLYLKAAADSHIFRVDADIAGLASRCKTAQDALSMALTFEKDSVVLYATMKNIVPEHLGRGQVEKILNEELKHVSIITAEMHKLKK
jgi:rubrerythrin